MSFFVFFLTREIEKRKSSHILHSAIKTRENTTGFLFLQLRVEGSIKGFILNKKIIRWDFYYFLFKFNKYTNLNHLFVLCTEWNRLICIFKILLQFLQFFSIFSFVFTERNRLICIGIPKFFSKSFILQLLSFKMKLFKSKRW